MPHSCTISTSVRVDSASRVCASCRHRSFRHFSFMAWFFINFDDRNLSPKGIFITLFFCCLFPLICIIKKIKLETKEIPRGGNLN